MKKFLPILVLLFVISGCSSKNPIDKLYNEGVERIENVDTLKEIKDYYLNQIKVIYDKDEEVEVDDFNKQISNVVLKYESCGSKINDLFNHIWINNYDMVNITGAEMEGLRGFYLSEKNAQLTNDSISGKGRFYSTFLNGGMKYKIGFDCKINITYDDNAVSGTFLNASSFKWVDNHIILDMKKMENKRVKEKVQFREAEAEDDFNLSEEENRVK